MLEGVRNILTACLPSSTTTRKALPWIGLALTIIAGAALYRMYGSSLAGRIDKDEPKADSNARLADQISKCPEFKQHPMMESLAQGFYPGGDLPQQFFDPFTAQHRIFENVYLGNLRAFMSINPRFFQYHTMTDSAQDVVGTDLAGNRALIQQVEQRLDRKGCSELGIQHVLSVTQFKPSPNVPAFDWSRFDPKVEQLGIQRMTLDVDDDEFAWDNIKPLLQGAFAFIDEARSKGEPILIHCVKGASRSVTVLTAYLMNRCGVTCDQAFNFIQTQRSIADLKPSIKSGLKQYEQELGIK